MTEGHQAGTDRHVDIAGQAADLDVQESESAGTGAQTTDEDNDVQTLRDKLTAAQREASEHQDKYLRARADMENFKKRIERTYADQGRRRQRELLRKLLGVRDNLERALHYGESAEASGESIIEGVRLTQYQLDQLLAQEGVKPMESQGKPFDPHREEALQSVDDPSVPDHTVVQVVRKGYVYEADGGEEVLRPAQVIVSVHTSEA